MMSSTREVKAKTVEDVKLELSTLTVLQKILPAAGGSFIEWYEFAIYSYVSSYITANFFADGRGGSMGTWAGFAITFAFRPLGGLVFGWLADRHGRKPAMQLTISLMLVTTVIQGCLPSFLCCGDEFGWLGFTLLLVCRALQGLSAGGELSTAAVYISEVSPPEALGANLSWISVSGAFGAWVAAALVVFCLEVSLDREAMMSWGWRVPYLTSVIPGAALIFARRYLKETEDFEALVQAVVEEKAGTAAEAGLEPRSVAAKGQSPLQELLGNYKLAVLIGSLGTAGIGSAWYVVPVYGISFIQLYDDIEPSSATLSSMVGFLIPTLLALPAGKLIDTWGVSRIHTLAIITTCLIAPIPLFYWWTHVPQHQATLAVFLGQIVVGFLLALTTSVYLWVVELFPVRVRGTGVSVAYNIGIGIFGGAGPLLCDVGSGLIPPTSFVSAPAAYTIFTGILSLAAIVMSRVLANKGMLKLTHIRDSPY